MARRGLWTVLGVMALALAGGGWLYLERTGAAPWGPAEAAAPPPAKAAAKAVTVEAAEVTVDTVVEDIRAVGTLQPNEAVIVSPEIPGRIARIGFGEGDEVAEGAVLVELDDTILRAELTKAQSDLTLAEANRGRAETLGRQGTGTLRARDEAIAAHRAALAEVALAEARLGKTRIAAPFSGIVGLRTVSAGAYVTPGDRLVALADIDPIKVDFRVPELVLSSLRAGQPIQLTVDAVPGRSFGGAVYAIDPVVDPNGRAVRLRAQVPNPERILFPGLFARLQIVVERRENALLVPESAVFAEGSQRYVFRVEAGRALRTAVGLGQRRPGLVEIREGLQPGAVVITAGHQKVRDGGPVEVVAPPAGS